MLFTYCGTRRCQLVFEQELGRLCCDNKWWLSKVPKVNPSQGGVINVGLISLTRVRQCQQSSVDSVVVRGPSESWALTPQLHDNSCSTLSTHPGHLNIFIQTTKTSVKASYLKKHVFIPLFRCQWRVWWLWLFDSSLSDWLAMHSNNLLISVPLIMISLISEYWIFNRLSLLPWIYLNLK